MVTRGRLPKKDITLKLSYLLLLAILSFSSVLSLVFFQGMSVWGDDPSYALLMPSIYNNTFKETANIFSVRPALLYPIAFFSKVFGFSAFGAGFYAFASYLLSIIITFLIGRALHSNKGGLLGSLLFAIYPGIIKANSTAESLLPLVLFLSLATLLFIYGKRTKNRWFYFLSGASTFVGALINPLAYIYAVFFAIYIIMDFARCLAAKNWRARYGYLMYFAGYAVAILAWGIVNAHIAYNGGPFYELTSTGSYFGSGSGQIGVYYPNTSLVYYPQGFFPYNFTSASSFYDQAFTENGAIITSGVNNEVGFFGYFAVIFGIYLLALRDKRYYFLLGMAAFIIGYLEFGTQSITHYQAIFKIMRYSVIAAMPIALITGFGVLDASARLFKRRSVLRWAFTWSIVAFLFATSLPLYYFYYIYNYNSMVYPKMIAESLLGAPSLSNSSLYGPILTTAYAIYYMGYPKMRAFGVYGTGKNDTLLLQSCSSIPNGSYVIIPDAGTLAILNSIGPLMINETWAYNPSKCNMTLYASLYNYSRIDSMGLYGESTLTGNIYHKG